MLTDLERKVLYAGLDQQGHTPKEALEKLINFEGKMLLTGHIANDDFTLR